MDDQVARPTRFGFGTRWNWLVGGVLGGIVGAILFGAILWSVDPEIITDTIPALYGVDAGPLGWVLHLAHGILLGVVFGFIITREFVLGVLTADVATGFIAAMGLGTRMALAGVVYGIALWTALPLIAQTVWALGGMPSPEFPFAAVESLIGHVLYGVILGILFSILVDVGPEAERADDPFEESAESR